MDIYLLRTVHRIVGKKHMITATKWMHDGIMNYVVVGDKDGYMVTGDDFSSWMEDTLDLIGKRRLFDICMPGSHDSGMSVCQNATLGASAHNTVTQTCDITGQLELGARY